MENQNRNKLARKNRQQRLVLERDELRAEIARLTAERDEARGVVTRIQDECDRRVQRERDLFNDMQQQAVNIAAERDAAIQRADTAEFFITNQGYRRCDIPACNCPYWHGGNASNRLREISEVLGDRTQGVTILDAVRALVEACDGGRDHG